MLAIAIVLSAVCAVALSSGVHHFAPAPALGPALAPAPVLATSSQYFQRNFNRLVLAPPTLEAPAVPFSPLFPAASFIPVASVLPPPAINFQTNPIVVDSAAKAPPDASTNPNPEPSQPPNVAIAIATSQGAAPVATILLPPYPFGAPQHFDIFQRPQQVFPQQAKDPEPTTSTTTTTEVPETTTTSIQDNVLPLSSNTNFAQGLPSSENALFNQYGAPKPASVEVVPVPLAYIAPPPYRPPTRQAYFTPTKTKIIVRPVSYRVRPVKIIITPAWRAARQKPQWRRTAVRDVEPTTTRALNNVKPPRF